MGEGFALIYFYYQLPDTPSHEHSQLQMEWKARQRAHFSPMCMCHCYSPHWDGSIN